MLSLLLSIITIVSFIALSGSLVFLNRAKKQTSNLQTTLYEKTTENAVLQTKIEALKAQYTNQIELLDETKKKLNAEFRNITHDLFSEKSKAFIEQNTSQVSSLLEPIKGQLKDFQKHIYDTYDKESKDRISLRTEVKGLFALNQQLSEDANKLTQALLNQSKTQGNWGEVILERILEKAGLQKGREYEVQHYHQTEAGQKQYPDVIVHLPEDKSIIIDSKVSIQSFIEFQDSTENAIKEKYIKAHVQSIKRHIQSLGQKNYHEIYSLKGLDFVLMFIPLEPAFTSALQYNSQLFQEAFEKNIILVSPTTLLTTLRTIANLWRHEYQNRNVLEIAKKSGALYDKFVNFLKDLEQIDKYLTLAQNSYDEAYKKLYTGKGNLVTSAEKIKALGAKTSKKLPDRMVENLA